MFIIYGDDQDGKKVTGPCKIFVPIDGLLNFWRSKGPGSEK